MLVFWRPNPLRLTVFSAAVDGRRARKRIAHLGESLVDDGEMIVASMAHYRVWTRVISPSGSFRVEKGFR